MPGLALTSHSKYTSDPFNKLFGFKGAPKLKDTIGASIAQREDKGKLDYLPLKGRRRRREKSIRNINTYVSHLTF